MGPSPCPPLPKQAGGSRAQRKSQINGQEGAESGGRGAVAVRATVAGQGSVLEPLRCPASDVSVRSTNSGPKTNQPVEVGSWK